MTPDCAGGGAGGDGDGAGEGAGDGRAGGDGEVTDMKRPTNEEHAAHVKAALEKGGWDTPLQWRKRKRRKPRNYQPRLPDPNPPEEKQGARSDL